MEFGNRPNCKKINDDVIDFASKEKPNLVVLAGLWGVYGWQELEASVRQLKLMGIAQIYIVGPVPRWEDDLPKLLFKYFNQDPQHKIPERMWFGFNKDIISLDAEMSEMSQRLEVNYISPYKILCDANGCLTKVGDTGASLTAWDVGHLTRSGSEFLVARFPRLN
jgi:hypothetical protein